MRDRAFKMGVANGVLFEVVMATSQPGTVLSAFVLRLTNSTFYATLPATLSSIGFLWPQLLVSNLAEARPHKKPIYVATSVVRAAMLALIALSTCWLAPDGSAGPILLFPLIYFVYASASGAGNLAFMDIVGKTIPATRRGSFLGLRGFYGGILGLGAGAFVSYMLGQQGPAFPINYACLFGVATLFVVISAAAFAAVPEPAHTASRARLPFGRHLAQGIALISRDAGYRRFYLAGLLSTMSTMGQVVFVPYALKELSLPEDIVGVLIVAAAVFALPANLLWSRISDRQGNRRLYLVASRAYLAVPVAAVASGLVPPLSLGLAGYDLRAGVFVLAWVLATVGNQGRGMAGMNYLLELAPEESRPSYIAFMNLLMAPAALVPLLAGALAELISFPAVFILSLVLGLGAQVLIRGLDEPRDR
jgi:MFS family permease